MRNSVLEGLRHRRFVVIHADIWVMVLLIWFSAVGLTRDGASCLVGQHQLCTYVGYEVSRGGVNSTILCSAKQLLSSLITEDS